MKKKRANMSLIEDRAMQSVLSGVSLATVAPRLDSRQLFPGTATTNRMTLELRPTKRAIKHSKLTHNSAATYLAHAIRRWRAFVLVQ